MSRSLRSDSSSASINRRSVRRGRFALATLGSVVLLAFVAMDAVAATNSARCRRLTRQISHFGNVAEMAANRGDDLWLDGTLAHIHRLSERRIKMCPEYDRPNQAEVMARWMAEATRTAAKAFIRYLTFGAY